MHGTKPLNKQCFDFTIEFKKSELSYSVLQTSVQHKKSKREKQIIVRLVLSDT